MGWLVKSKVKKEGRLRLPYIDESPKIKASNGFRRGVKPPRITGQPFVPENARPGGPDRKSRWRVPLGGAQGCENGWALGPPVAQQQMTDGQRPRGGAVGAGDLPPGSRWPHAALRNPYRVRGPIEIADPGRRCAGPGQTIVAGGRLNEVT